MIRIGDLKFNEEHKAVIDDIMDSGRITEGKYVKLFEREVEQFLDVKHCIAVSNGTVALELVSRYLGQNGVVCVPALTFPATLNAFLVTGQSCGLCDVGEDLQIDVDTMTEADKEKIDVIVPVHLMGYTADMDKIMAMAEKYDWVVVEDTAEAFGAEYKCKKAGTFGHFGTFSFYVSHNIWGGELGCVVTDDDEAAEVLRSMKNHGRAGDPMKFQHKYIGANYKTTEFCAGLAYVNLKHADEILPKRKSISDKYFRGIKNPKLTPFPSPNGFSPLGYPILAESEEYRDKMCERLNKAGIETRGMFPSLANQQAYKGLWKSEEYPVAEELEKRAFYIGSHQYIEDEDIELILEMLNYE